MRNKKRNKYLLLLILLLAVSVGYALLSTTLKINGSATITKNNWSVYWANPQVTEGSVTTAVPTLSAEGNQTLNTIATWSTTLSLPGDFYEFTIDAVNNGTIDAMITDIQDTVTPALPNYISYKVTYADGVVIDENHLLPKKTGNTATTEKYKVRVEFLDTITPEQMKAIPEGGATYTFNYAVTYVQATDAAIAKPVKWVLPQGKTANTLAVGDEICSGLPGIDDQCFNFIRYDGNDVVMLAKYNLNVGSNAKGTETFKQDSDVRGDYAGMTTYGNVAFSATNYWSGAASYPTDVYDATNYKTAPDFSTTCDSTHCYNTPGYSVAYYVEEYKDILETAGATVKNARLLTYTEATIAGCNGTKCPTTSFITNTTFWLETSTRDDYVRYVASMGYFEGSDYYSDDIFGVRPVIVVEKSNL